LHPKTESGLDQYLEKLGNDFKDVDIIQYDGHEQYTNPNAKNPQ
jgi:hypothetical protein